MKITGLLLSLVTVLLMQACGGGGGSGSGSDPTPISVAKAATVSSFTPATAVAGDTVTVTGTGLNLVTSMSMGGADAKFTVQSETKLLVVVPVATNSSSSNFVVTGKDFSFVVPNSLTVAVPTVNTVSSTSMLVGSSITVTGSMLDKVKVFSINGTPFTVANLTATSVTLTAPTTAMVGYIELTDVFGVMRQSQQQLTLYVHLVVTSLSATTAIGGDLVTAEGAGLNRATSVKFANGIEATITSTTPGSLIFKVPSQAMNGSATYSSPVTISGPGEQSVSQTALSIYASIRVANSTGTTGANSTDVVVNGSNLSLVTKASVGGVAATISGTDDLLRLNVSGTAGGTVLLSTTHQTDVVAGTVRAAADGVLAISALNFSQVFDKSGVDPSLRLTPIRPVLARAFVVASSAGIVNPGVSLEVSNAGNVLGILTMTGQATLPMTVDTANLNSAYNVTVPGAWITPGVSFKATVAQRAGSSVSASITAAPTVGAATRMHIVLVPLNINGTIATAPTPAEVRNAFSRAFPLAYGDIVVTTRASYSATGITGFDTFAEISSLLSQVEKLRSLEDKSAYYYGLMPYAINKTNIIGLGYVGTKGYEAQSPTSAVGFDGAWPNTLYDPFKIAQPVWAQTMMHEVGHNNSLLHTSCKTYDGIDPNYPYADGGLNADYPMYSSLYTDDTSIGLMSPTNPSTPLSNFVGPMTDLMGYCSGTVLSDYSYSKAQGFIEARTFKVPAAMKLASTNQNYVNKPVSYLEISGSIANDRVTLNPAKATSIAPQGEPLFTAPYAVRVTTASGQVLDFPMVTYEIADAPESTSHFVQTIVNPGNVVKVDVLKNGKVLSAADSPKAFAMKVTGPVDTSIASTWTEANGVLNVKWNSATEKYATVVYLGKDGVRLVLGMDYQGGSAAVSTKALPAGGQFELSFSSQFNARLVKVNR